jgi:hypothetical protein
MNELATLGTGNLKTKADSSHLMADSESMAKSNLESPFVSYIAGTNIKI